LYWNWCNFGPKQQLTFTRRKYINKYVFIYSKIFRNLFIVNNRTNFWQRIKAHFLCSSICTENCLLIYFSLCVAFRRILPV
jgi:hypothetical protein